ncbi:MAG: T6SS immunity protein Tli4 family protein [Acinetobacter sp.]
MLNYFIVMLLIMFAGLFLYNQPARLSDKEKSTMDSLFEKTKVQCIGRYVFDVPSTFINTQHASVMINEYRIETQRMYPPAFEQMINLRENELKVTETIHSRDMPFLKKSIALENGQNGVIFDRNESVSIPGYGRTLETHFYHNGVAFTVTKNFDDLSDDKYSQDKAEYIEAGVSEKSFTLSSVQIREMKNMLTTLSGRQDTDIPTIPGTCIADGYISDDEKTKERMSLVYNTEYNIDFSIMTNNFLREKNSLLDRTGGVSEALSQINGRIIKKEASIINGIKVEELLTVGEDTNGPGKLYQFMLMANEKNTDFNNPILSVSLNNYGPEESLLNEAQIIDLWERITRSIRIRPGAF